MVKLSTKDEIIDKCIDAKLDRLAGLFSSEALQPVICSRASSES
jgi:hypothetical protein